MKNTAFPGGITGRWSRVNNFRYYEYQATSPTDPTVGPGWNALPIHSSHAAQATFSDHPAGQLIHICTSAPWERPEGPLGGNRTFWRKGGVGPGMGQG